MLELWQMATLEDVMRVPTIVANGAQTDVTVAAAFGRTDRQGRYMIKAAELLGLIARPKTGVIGVTPLGKLLMSTSGSGRLRLERQIVADSAAGRALLTALGAGFSSIDELSDYFNGLGTSSPSPSTLRRRLGELLKWFTQLGLAQQTGGAFSLTGDGAHVESAPQRIKSNKAPGSVIPSRRKIVDVEKRKAIESAAITVVEDYYTNLGFDVQSRESDNLGWDLEVLDSAADEPILVEVKGTSLRQFAVDLSANEYEKMLLHRRRYRLCVVTDALGNPLLHEFVFDVLNDRWVHAETGVILTITPLTAARAYISK